MALLVLAALALVTQPPFEWLPAAGDEMTRVLGALLAAQAAIAALTLAVTLFALERVSARPEADDRIFDEYVSQLRMRRLFLGGLVTVAVTGSVLLAGEFASDSVSAVPGVRNLTLVAATAFFVSVAIPVVLFVRTLRFARPSAWRELRRRVNERDVRNAVRVFLARRARLQAGDFADGESEFTVDLVPDPGEGSADEAIRMLLEDAIRAIDERRDAEFGGSLDSILSLVEYALDELSRHDWKWGEPGSEAKWPPLAELGRNLYRLRDAVVRRGERAHASELASLDQRLIWMGMARGCGELLSAALQGWESNYELAARIGNHEFRELFRRWTSRELDAVVLQQLGDRDPAYLAEAVRHHAGVLFLAMERGYADDFEALVGEFDKNWANAKTIWRYSPEHRPGDADIQDIEWMHRYIIMGLAGCALRLAHLGRLTDAQPYIEAARSVFSSVEQLTHDFVLAKDSDWDLMFVWRNPEISESGSTGSEWVGPGHYAVRFFLLRLLELARAPMPGLDLRSEAQQLRRWFEVNSEQVEPYVRADGDLTVHERHELVLEALEEAVRRDEGRSGGQ